MFIEESLYFAEWNYLYIVIQSYYKSLEKTNKKGQMSS